MDMLSFAIRSEEDDAEKVDADGHSDSSSEDELVKLEVRPTRQFPRQRTEPQEPTRNKSFTLIWGGGQKGFWVSNVDLPPPHVNNEHSLRL